MSMQLILPYVSALRKLASIACAAIIMQCHVPTVPNTLHDGKLLGIAALQLKPEVTLAIAKLSSFWEVQQL